MSKVSGMQLASNLTYVCALRSVFFTLVFNTEGVCLETCLFLKN